MFETGSVRLAETQLFVLHLSILRKKLHKKQILGQNIWNEVFEILGHYGR